MQSPVVNTLLLASLLAPAHAAAEDELLKPFIVASVEETTLAQTAERTVAALENAGFELAGQYSPTDDSVVIIVTSDELLRVAAASDRGGYGAGQRVGLSEVDGGVEITFVNPVYMQHAYRLEGDLGGVREQLVETLGFERECGAGDKKMTAERLERYRYMLGMQRFDDPSELGRFETHEAALEATEQGLARAGDGLSRVYRIDIPGKQQSVFGVGLKSTGDDGARIDEAEQLAVVDFEGCRKRAYFPYEILVNGPEVEALHMRFRMAVHFPNLPMMGKHGFTKLMPYPGDIEDSLEQMVEASGSE